MKIPSPWVDRPQSSEVRDYIDPLYNLPSQSSAPRSIHAWLQSRFKYHGIVAQTPINNSIDNVTWTGRDIHLLRESDMERDLVAWGMNPAHARGIARDVVEARGLKKQKSREAMYQRFLDSFWNTAHFMWFMFAILVPSALVFIGYSCVKATMYNTWATVSAFVVPPLLVTLNVSLTVGLYLAIVGRILYHVFGRQTTLVLLVGFAVAGWWISPTLPCRAGEMIAYAP